MQIREAQKDDLPALLALYEHLHGEAPPPMSPELEHLWGKIRANPDHHIFCGMLDGRLTASCVLVVVPNLTHGQRPYAIVENVVTHPDCRGRGCGLRLLEHAKSAARQAGCYKISLMTGVKRTGTVQFYERAGFNRQDKIGFVHWLDK